MIESRVCGIRVFLSAGLLHSLQRFNILINMLYLSLVINTHRRQTGPAGDIVAGEQTPGRTGPFRGGVSRAPSPSRSVGGPQCCARIPQRERSAGAQEQNRSSADPRAFISSFQGRRARERLVRARLIMCALFLPTARASKPRRCG